MAIRILNCDVMEGLRQLADQSVHCVVTSPPYWGLRDYGIPGQIGLEPTPDAFVARLVDVFREVNRVLRDDGTLWLNLGDSYAGHNLPGWRPGNETKNGGVSNKNGVGYVAGLKPKDLVGIPWRVAFALQADGWWLRQDIIWAKPNPMPESVTDRCTKAHEYVFLLSKSERYHYDHEAIQEPFVYSGDCRMKTAYAVATAKSVGTEYRAPVNQNGRNKRSVWNIPTAPFPEAHFATFPPELPELCIKAGCPKGGTVLDPFSGAGTTALVADRLQRDAIGIELNPEYSALSSRRLDDDRGGLLDMMEAR